MRGMDIRHTFAPYRTCPFGFYPHCMAATQLGTPKTAMSSTELNDEVDFDGVFSNYGNSSPLKI